MGEPHSIAVSCLACGGEFRGESRTPGVTHKTVGSCSAHDPPPASCRWCFIELKRPDEGHDCDGDPLV